jgi:hypothetical protein
LLELFYKDPQRLLRYQYSETGTSGEGDTPRFGILMMMFVGRWGYTFQTYAFLSRMMAQLQPAEADVPEGRHSRASLQSNASSVVFYERSVFSDRYIFAENCAGSCQLLSLSREKEVFSIVSFYSLVPPPIC